MGGGKSGSGGEAHDYFGTIAGLVCAGPVDELVSIQSDNKTVWPIAPLWSGASRSYTAGDLVTNNGVVWQCLESHVSTGTTLSSQWRAYALRRSEVGMNPVQVSVEGFGTLILYWGTDDQTLDPVSEPTFYAAHPNYRRQCFVILKDWLFGRERISAPSVQVVVRRAAQQSIFTDTGIDTDGQSNPLGILAESIQDPIFGLGLPATAAESGSWEVAAAALTASAPKSFLSPVLTRGAKFSQIAQEALAYVDGWARWNESGKIEVGLYHNGGAPPPFGEDKTITPADLASEVEFSAESWGDTLSAATVKFLDRNRSWKERAATSQSIFNRATDGAPKIQSVDRNWITRASQAAAHAGEMIRRFSIPGLSGTLKCLGPKVRFIIPGAQFRLKHDAAGLDVVCRCTAKNVDAPPDDTVSLQFEVERAFAPEMYQPPADDASNPLTPDPEVVSVFRFVSFADGAGERLALLAARTDPTTTRARVNMRQADGVSFYELGAQTAWNVGGVLQASYSSAVALDDDSEGFRVTLDAGTVNADLARVLQTQTADAIEDDALIAWVFDGSGTFELFAVKAMRIVGADTFYRLKVKRARLGTNRLTFAAGAQVFIGYRDDLTFYSHASFAGFASAATTATFRIQPRNIWKEAAAYDTVACPDRTHTFGSQFCTVSVEAASAATTWRALTDAAPVVWAVDPSKTQQQASVTITASRTLSITGATNGMRFQLRVKQGGAGGFGITLPAGSKVAGGGGGAVTLSAAAGAEDLLTGYFDGTSYFWSIQLNFT